jgi:hypothetical protein
MGKEKTEFNAKLKIPKNRKTKNRMQCKVYGSNSNLRREIFLGLISN